MNPVSESSFRHDINGLRALAVVAVVLYHFGVPGFDGGFVGVDVFFVISGLLMTGIVTRGLENQRFSVWDFYLARGRRIIPALLALCISLLVLGWFFLPVSDYKQLGSHVATSASFLSNMKYWLEAGYFDASSHEKWLLHTWSLAVEWQFYVALPLAMLVLWRFSSGRKTLTVALLSGFAVSIALCALYTPTKPTGTFFLLPTRAWEMLAGGLLYLLASPWQPNEKSAKFMELLGLTLIAACVFWFNPQMAWPGWGALVPVAGACLVMAAARQGSLWTGAPIAQWLGTRSYSLYLWHWPLVVALEYAQLQSSPAAVGSAIALTLILGHASYRWIETPTRLSLTRTSPKNNMLLMGSATVLVCGVGSAVFVCQGLPGRLPPAIDVMSAEAKNSNPRKEACHLFGGVVSPSCEYGAGSLKAIVLGDSHGDAVMSAVADSAFSTLGNDAMVMQWTYSACPILHGVKAVGNSNSQCGSFVDWALQKLKTISPKVPVIIVGRHGQYIYGKNEEVPAKRVPQVYFTQQYRAAEPAFVNEYAQRLESTACQIAQTRPVYLLRPVPEMEEHIPNTARAMVFGETDRIGVSVSAYEKRNAAIWVAQDIARDKCGAKILDPLPYLCHQGFCDGVKNGRPLYFDNNHLSEFGNKFLIPMFSTVFQVQSPVDKTEPTR